MRAQGYTVLPTDQIALHIAPRVDVAGLIRLVDQSPTAISYWVDSYTEIKRGDGMIYQYNVTTIDRGNEYLISVNTVIDGIQKIVAGNSGVANRYVNYVMSDLAMSLDGGYIDEPTTDLIIQLGLFGEVIYG